MALDAKLWITLVEYLATPLVRHALLTYPGAPNEDNPQNRLEATAYMVLEGLRRAMAEANDSPVTDETYLEGLHGVKFALCVGLSGRLYVYSFQTNMVQSL